MYSFLINIMIKDLYIPPNNKFKKDEKLCKRDFILSLFENRKNKIKGFPLRLIWEEQDLETSFPAQILISVPKRNIRKASDRNLIKRRIRESYRKNKIELYKILKKNNIQISIGVIYTHNQILDYQEIETKIIISLQKLITKIENIYSNEH